MIYSKRLNDYIPVKIETQTHKFGNNETFTRYLVKDNRITIGRVDLIDTANGVEVQYIENYHNQLYSNFGKIADQLEVEHCLKRGLDKFEINSYGSLNSHALHYIRGKRFFADEVPLFCIFRIAAVVGHRNMIGIGKGRLRSCVHVNTYAVGVVCRRNDFRAYQHVVHFDIRPNIRAIFNGNRTKFN